LLAFAFDRSSREYLWFALFLWLDGSASLMSCFDGVYPIIGPACRTGATFLGSRAVRAPHRISGVFHQDADELGGAGYQVALLIAPEVILACAPP